MMVSRSTAIILSILTAFSITSVFYFKSFSDHEDRKIKVMTFNIRYDNPDDGAEKWEFRRDLLVSVIKDEDPDFLGVQEALPNQVEFLRDQLPGYLYNGRGRNYDGSGEASAQFVKSNKFTNISSGHFWLSETPYIAGSQLPNASLPRMVSWIHLRRKNDNTTLFYFNTHYDNVFDFVRARESEIFLDQIRNITNVSELKNLSKVILSGDYNSLPNETSILKILNSTNTNFRDTITAVKHHLKRDFGTFHGWTGKANGTRIDYVFVTEDVEIKKYKIIHAHNGTLYPSDHFPVISHLEL